MTDLYVKAGGTPNPPYGSWTDASTSLKTAIEAAGAGDTVWVDNSFVETISASTAITLAASRIRVVSTSDVTNTPPTTFASGAAVTIDTTGVTLTLAGAHSCSWHGFVFNLGDSTKSAIVNVCNTAQGRRAFIECQFNVSGNNALSAISTDTNQTARVVFERCGFLWTNTAQGFLGDATMTWIDCDMSTGSTHPSVILEIINDGFVGDMIGCDLTDITTIVEATVLGGVLTLRQCSLKSAYVLVDAQSTNLPGEAYAYDCAVGDSHIMMHHVNFYGSTIVDTTIYANDNAGDEDLSWKIVTTANASKATPYYSPWLHKYHSGTSEITPYLECVRSGSSSAFNEDQLWAEITAKTTSGSCRVDLYSNRSDPCTTGVANTSSSKTGADWFGEDGTSWFGKLQLNGPITPAEPGYMGARVGVAEPSITVYVDPTIRT